MNFEEAKKQFEAAFDAAWQQLQADSELGASSDEALAAYNMALEAAESEYQKAIFEIVTQGPHLLVSFG